MAFIPSAERYGLLPQIDQWMIKHLLENFPHEILASNPDSFVAVNLSAASLNNSKFQSMLVNEQPRRKQRGIRFDMSWKIRGKPRGIQPEKIQHDVDVALQIDLSQHLSLF